MPLRLVRSLVMSMLAGLTLAACSGSPTSSTPEPTPPATVTSYVGTLAIHGLAGEVGQVGSMTLTVTVPAGAAVASLLLTEMVTGVVTGTLKVEGAAVTPLTGSLNTTTGALSVSGGGYQVSATIATDGILTGTGTIPGGRAMAVTATVSTASSPTVSLCGRYTGMYYAGLNSENENGSVNLVIKGVPYATNRYRVDGQAPTSGQTTPGTPTTITFSGTAELATGQIPANMADGSLSMVSTNGGNLVLNASWLGDHYYGTYHGSDAHGISEGTWNAYRC
jgi:hypothetical protein